MVVYEISMRANNSLHPMRAARLQIGGAYASIGRFLAGLAPS